MRKYSVMECLAVTFLILYILISVIIAISYGSTPTEELPGWFWIFAGRKCL